MDLSQRTKFCHQLLHVFENFVSVYEPLVRSSFDVPNTQMSIFVLFIRAGVLFEGAFFPGSILKVSNVHFRWFLAIFISKNCYCSI